jgi:hypothetical protein
MSNIKNYTSTIPSITSQGRIEKCLIDAGATDISKKYHDGICIAITFRIEYKTQEKPRTFKSFWDALHDNESAMSELLKLNKSDVISSVCSHKWEKLTIVDRYNYRCKLCGKQK